LAQLAEVVEEYVDSK